MIYIKNKKGKIVKRINKKTLKIIIFIEMISIFLIMPIALAEDGYISNGIRPMLISHPTSGFKVKSQAGHGKLDSSGVMGVGISYDWIPSGSTGFNIYYKYFQNFKIYGNSFDGFIVGPDTNNIPTDNPTSISLQNIGINLTYGMGSRTSSKNVFVFFGLNYSFFHISDKLAVVAVTTAPPSSTKVMTIESGSGGIGYQAGIGAALGSRIIFEGKFQVYELNKDTNHFASFFDPPKAFSSMGLELTLGYIF